MAPLNMEGPHRLRPSVIDRMVAPARPGNYALGRLDDHGTFLVEFVGRADAELGVELGSWIGQTHATHFKFSYAAGIDAAFAEECRTYHEFLPPENVGHPRPPRGRSGSCPYCDELDGGDAA